MGNQNSILNDVILGSLGSGLKYRMARSCLFDWKRKKSGVGAQGNIIHGSIFPAIETGRKMESVNKLRLDFIFPSSRREGAVAATVLNKRRVPGWKLVKDWPTTWRLTIGRWLLAMVVVVAMITITITILSMVLEETVRAMRKEDITQAKVVQPALYARRWVLEDFSLIRKKFWLSPQNITFTFHHQVEECNGVQDCFCELTPVSLYFCRSQVFLSQQFIQISESFTEPERS